MFPEFSRPSRWNIVGDEELNNLQLVNLIGDMLETEPTVEFIDFHNARPGHDRRYALDGRKIHDAGWRPPVDLHESLRRVIQWSIDHPEWLA
jgi:dTDP-glucose 4,6-dehydratase